MITRFTIPAVVLLATSASLPAHAGPDVREAIHAATSQAIAAPGNRALRAIRDETLRILQPVLPAPADDSNAQADTDTKPAGE